MNKLKALLVAALFVVLSAVGLVQSQSAGANQVGCFLGALDIQSSGTHVCFAKASGQTTEVVHLPATTSINTGLYGGSTIYYYPCSNYTQPACAGHTQLQGVRLNTGGSTRGVNDITGGRNTQIDVVKVVYP